jgi:hypothetical protein
VNEGNPVLSIFESITKLIAAFHGLHWLRVCNSLCSRSIVSAKVASRVICICSALNLF